MRSEWSRRRRGGAVAVSVSVSICLLAAGRAPAQEGNPLDRMRGAPPPAVDPARPWIGCWADIDEELVVALYPSAAWAGQVGGYVIREARGADPEPWPLRAALAGGAVEGTFAAGGEWRFTARVEGDELVFVTGRTRYRLARFRHTPAGVRTAEELEQRIGARPAPDGEAAAVGALRTIAVAQALFRETDREGDGIFDYGSLRELAGTGLIDELLGSGARGGYLVRCEPSTTTPELLFRATAAPREPGRTGSRWYATNQAGVIYYSTRGELRPDPATCDMPPDATPLGGEERPSSPAAPPAGPAAAPAPDLSHVRAGQRWIYELQAGLEMHYVVREVGAGRVRYAMEMFMDGNPIGDPQEQVFPLPDPGGPSAHTTPEMRLVRRERVTVSGYELECKVMATDAGGVETIVSQVVSGDVVTFPVFTWVETAGTVNIRLVRVEPAR